MSITAAKVRAPLMRLCAAPVVPGPCNPVPAADVPALPSTWAMMILGFDRVGCMAYRGRRSGSALTAA